MRVKEKFFSKIDLLFNLLENLVFKLKSEKRDFYSDSIDLHLNVHLN